MALQVLPMSRRPVLAGLHLVMISPFVSILAVMVCFADFGGFDCRCNFSKLVGLALEPIRGPDAMYDPSHDLQHC